MLRLEPSMYTTSTENGCMSILEILEKLDVLPDNLYEVEHIAHLELPEFYEAWANSDSLLIFCATIEVPLPNLIAATCGIAQIATPCLPAWETRPQTAFDVAKRWAVGEATREELEEARKALGSAISVDLPFIQNDAILAAYMAVSPEEFQYIRKLPLSYLVYRATTEAGYSEVSFARHATQCADILREHIPYSMVEGRLKALGLV